MGNSKKILLKRGNRSQSRKQLLAKALKYLSLFAVTAIFFAPIYYMIIGSFKPNDQVLDGLAGFVPHDLSFDNYTMATDYSDRIESRDSVNRAARKLRGEKTTKAVSMLHRLERIPSDSRRENEKAQIEVLRNWYNTIYLGADKAPGLFRELQAKASGEEIDVSDTVEVLEQTAETVMEEAKFYGSAVAE